MKKTEAECCDVVAAHTDIIREVRAKMPGEVTIQELADFYKVFGDATRIRILCAFCRPKCVSATWAELLGHESVCHFTSASDPEADEACEEQKRGKDCLLFTG